ncbi:MAG: serine/threonine protein kinase [Candidatus Micrarchaeota archaeon]|nr:serine/threonine protein kinase [Candidatus Micrarchaeota archaeon]
MALSERSATDIGKFVPILRGSHVMVHQEVGLTNVERKNLASMWGTGERGFGQISPRLHLKMDDTEIVMREFADLVRMYDAAPRHVTEPVGMVYSTVHGFRGYISEYVPGRHIANVKNTPIDERRNVAEQLVNAVGMLHSKGATHGDISGHNARVCRHTKTLKLFDPDTQVGASYQLSMKERLKVLIDCDVRAVSRFLRELKILDGSLERVLEACTNRRFIRMLYETPYFRDGK